MAIKMNCVQNYILKINIGLLINNKDIVKAHCTIYCVTNMYSLFIIIIFFLPSVSIPEGGLKIDEMTEMV